VSADRPAPTSGRRAALRLTQRRALGWCAVAAVAALVWLAWPLVVGLFLGTLMGFTLEPIYRALVRRTGRPVVASLATVLAAGLGIVGAAVGFLSLFVARAIAFAGIVSQALAPGGAASTWADTLNGWLGRVGLSIAAITDKARESAGEALSRSASLAGMVASGTLGGLLDLFFALLTMHLVLLHWDRMVATLEVVAPLRREYTRALLVEFRQVGRSTLVGTVVTALAQGGLAGIGYWLTGVPQPAFFGIATALASLVPAIGTLLVWVPAGLYLFATGHPGAGTAELVWGALVVVGFSDYVLRPRLVGDEAMPALLTFVALFGGLEVMGLAGLVVGPVLMSLAVVVLRLYAREVAARRAASSGRGAGP
jgi:predicted PurR-regulated permease PerM